MLTGSNDIINVCHSSIWEQDSTQNKRVALLHKLEVNNY